MNITDVDDKIIRGAAAPGIAIGDYTAALLERASSSRRSTLRTHPPVLPHATGHIPDMVALIRRSSTATSPIGPTTAPCSSGSRRPSTGSSPRSTSEAIPLGERVEVDEYEKDDVRDFALWKGPNPGEPSWDTAIGPGRPGWHIECSAMSMPTRRIVDLHAGGDDLIFPHHENEIAQSEAATGKPFVRTWLHCAHLQMSGARSEVDRQHRARRRGPRVRRHPRALRYALIAVHYRAPLKLHARLAGRGRGRRRTPRRARRRPRGVSRGRGRRPDPARRSLADARAAFDAAMDDDLNVSAALAAVFDFVREINRRIDARSLSTATHPRPSGFERRTRFWAFCRTTPTSSSPSCDRCSTTASRHARRATGRRRTACATSWRATGSPSRTRATASAGAGSWRPAVADQDDAEPQPSAEEGARHARPERPRPPPKPRRLQRPRRPPTRPSRPRAQARDRPQACDGRVGEGQGLARQARDARASKARATNARPRPSPRATRRPHDAASASGRARTTPGPVRDRPREAPAGRGAWRPRARAKAREPLRAPRMTRDRAVRRHTPNADSRGPPRAAMVGVAVRRRDAGRRRGSAATRPIVALRVAAAGRTIGGRRIRPATGPADDDRGSTRARLPPAAVPWRPASVRSTLGTAAGPGAIPVSTRRSAAGPGSVPVPPGWSAAVTVPTRRSASGAVSTRRTARWTAAGPVSTRRCASSRPPGRTRPQAGASTMAGPPRPATGTARPSRNARPSPSALPSARVPPAVAAGPGPARPGRGARRRPTARRGGIRREAAGHPAARRSAASPGARAARPPRDEPAHPDRRGRRRDADGARRVRRPPGDRPRRRPRTWASLDEILARGIERGEPPFVLVLDSLEDPQNVGTLLRSAEAAGVHGVVFPTRHQAPLTPSAVKASAGAVEHLLLCPVDDLAGALSDLHIRGVRDRRRRGRRPADRPSGRLPWTARDRRRQRGPGPLAGRPTALRPRRPDPDARRRRLVERRGRGLDPAVRGARPARSRAANRSRPSRARPLPTKRRAGGDAAAADEAATDEPAPPDDEAADEQRPGTGRRRRAAPGGPVEPETPSELA